MADFRKITLFIDSLGAGGAQRQIVGLANQLSELGNLVSILIYRDVLFFEGILSKKVSLHVLKEGKCRRILEAYLYVRKEKPDWLISFLETPSEISCLVKMFYPKFNLIVSERNTTQCVGMKERFRFNIFRLADYVVSNSYSQTDFIKREFPFLQHKALTIVNFVDLDYFTFFNRTRNAVPQILVAASLWYSKNALNFIRAMKIVLDMGGRFNVKWFGFVPGTTGANLDYYNECRLLIAKLGLENHVQLLDKTSNIREEYYKADYFCLPSFYEGTPNVICEAMATGLPVICSDVCDNGVYVKEGINGFLFNPLDITNMAKVILMILNLNDETWKRFCVNSRKIAEEKLAVRRFMRQYLEVIDSI